MAKPSRETSQHILTTGPVLAQRRGLSAAVQGRHLSWEGNSLPSHHHSIIWRPSSQSPVRALALLGFMGSRPTRRVCGPPSTSQSLRTFPKHPEAAAEAPAAERGGRMALSLPDSALGSAPGHLLFSQHQDIESRSASL